MSSVRANPDFTEIDAHYVTYKRKLSSTGAIDFLYSASAPYPTATSTQEGQSVAMDTNDTVKVGAAGDVLIGKHYRSEADGTCGVQDRGYMTFAYVADATAPVLGRGVVCNGTGGVAIAASGSEWKERGEVTKKDATTLTVTVKIP